MCSRAKAAHETMMCFEDILWSRIPQIDLATPEMDPLREAGALQESQLLDVRVHTLSSVVGLIIEMRTALQLRGGNAAALLFRGVREFAWSADARETNLTAWNVVGSELRWNPNRINMELSFWPDARLEVSAICAEFYVAQVPGLSEDPPDYVATQERGIREDLVNWGSSFTPIQATFYGTQY